MRQDIQQIEDVLRQWDIEPASPGFEARILAKAFASTSLRAQMAFIWVPRHMVAMMLCLVIGLVTGWDMTEPSEDGQPIGVEWWDETTQEEWLL